MTIQVLGSGCAKCKKLHEVTKEAVKQLKLEADVEYSTDVSKIVALGVMSSPVLTIDGKPVLVGKVPDMETLKSLIATLPAKACCEGKLNNTCCKPMSAEGCCQGKSSDTCCEGKSEDDCCKGKSTDTCCKAMQADDYCQGKTIDACCKGKTTDACCKDKSEDACCQGNCHRGNC